MIVNFAQATGTTLATELAADLNAGAGTGQVEFYEGSMPSSPDDPIAGQTLLAELDCSATPVTSALNVVTFNAIAADTSTNATGTIQFARIVDKDGNAIVDLDVTDLAGDGAIKVNTTSVIIGGTLGISSLSITL